VDDRKKNFLNGFIYKTQHRKTIHLIYLPFTKNGSIFFGILFLWLYLYGYSFLWLMSLIFGFILIYVFFLREKYYEKERVWLISKIVTFLNEKHELPHKNNSFFFDIKK